MRSRDSVTSPTQKQPRAGAAARRIGKQSQWCLREEPNAPSCPSQATRHWCRIERCQSSQSHCPDRSDSLPEPSTRCVDLNERQGRKSHQLHPRSQKTEWSLTQCPKTERYGSSFQGLEEAFHGGSASCSCCRSRRARSL